jgi:hypothetical protein
MTALVTRSATRPIEGAIERIITHIPASHVDRSALPAKDARQIVHRAAKRTALTSGALALPPGPLGLLTILPDLHLIWSIQRQMVADLFALHGRTVELTRTHMLYCLFRHAASHVARDIAVRSGQRVLVRQLSGGALRTALGTVGVDITRRVAGHAAGRWVPFAGAAAVASYAYWDTLQVARTSRELLAAPED